MPRTPGIWFRKQTGWYCTKLNGVVHKLDRDEAKAKKAFYKLMAKDAPAATRPAERHSVRWLCDKFLDRTRTKKAAETFEVQLDYLRQFCAAFGARPADSLKSHEVNEWIDARGWMPPRRCSRSSSSRPRSTGRWPRTTWPKARSRR